MNEHSINTLISKYAINFCVNTYRNVNNSKCTLNSINAQKKLTWLKRGRKPLRKNRPASPAKHRKTHFVMKYVISDSCKRHKHTAQNLGKVIEQLSIGKKS